MVAGSINLDLVVRSPGCHGRAKRSSAAKHANLPAVREPIRPSPPRGSGADVAMIGRVGDDGFGQRLRAGLQDEGIDVSRVAVTPNCASGLAIVAVDDGGENAITVIPGANGRLTPADVRAAANLIADADVLLLQLEVPLETVLSTIELAREHDTLVILDPAPAPASFPTQLLAVDVVCPNETEAAALTGIAIANLADAKQSREAFARDGDALRHHHAREPGSAPLRTGRQRATRFPALKYKPSIRPPPATRSRRPWASASLAASRFWRP